MCGEAGIRSGAGDRKQQNGDVDLWPSGTLALVQNDLAEARRRYLEALAVIRAWRGAVGGG
ncbi:MAG: hypothetical protein H6647_19960 [Anaerolineales bacterium]|nr:hypothetical protein [Anaerolineales bacterium]